MERFSSDKRLRLKVGGENVSRMLSTTFQCARPGDLSGVRAVTVFTGLGAARRSWGGCVVRNKLLLRGWGRGGAGAQSLDFSYNYGVRMAGGNTSRSLPGLLWMKTRREREIGGQERKFRWFTAGRRATPAERHLRVLWRSQHHFTCWSSIAV